MFQVYDRSLSILSILRLDGTRNRSYREIAVATFGGVKKSISRGEYFFRIGYTCNVDAFFVRPARPQIA